MKKLFLCLTGIALLGLTLTSCNKEEDLINGNPVFTATFDGGAKTTIIDGSDTDTTELSWANGDAIKIFDGNNSNNSATYTTTSTGATATFTYSQGSTISDGASTYKALYPASAASVSGQNMKITLPAKQTYISSGIMTGFPMYAESGNTSLQFKNLCGILRLHLKNLNKSVRTITITADQALTGNFTVAYNGGSPTLTAAGDHNNTNSVVLDCGTNGISIAGDGAYFHIYLPAQQYTNFNVEIMYTDYKVTNKTASAFTVSRNTRYTLTLVGNESSTPNYNTKGVFSVSATKKVYIAPANLINKNGVWGFCDAAYDYTTSYNAADQDHLGWSTDANNYGIYAPSTSYVGNFKDWGAVMNGGTTTNTDNELTWYTLSTPEWQFLLNQLSASNSTRDGNWTFAKVNGYRGLLLLPDTYTWPNTTISNKYEAEQKEWKTNKNVFTLDDWNLMAANGAAFLPCAGYRNGEVYDCYDSSTAPWNGYYWTSTNSSSTQANSLYIANNVTPNCGKLAKRYQGYCVRLVCTAIVTN